MSFRDLIDTSAALALSEKLFLTEEAVWERYCREFSIKFSTPLMQVRELDPLFVMTQVNCENLAAFEPEENMDQLWEMLGQLKDKDYDHKKEMAIREEMRQIEEREKQRLENGEAIHKSLEKDKRIIAKDPIPKDMPKNGGINMGLINKLNNQDREG